MKKIKRSGYWYLYFPEHPFSGKQGYIAEHRVVIEKSIGRYLTPQEAVHHIDNDRANNSLDNLQLFATHGEHTKIAHPEVMDKLKVSGLGRRPPNYNRGVKVCPICTKEFETTLGSSGKKFCSHQCYGKSKIGVQPKNMEGLKLGHGWNKGKKADWVAKGKDSPSYKHGKYSKYA